MPFQVRFTKLITLLALVLATGAQMCTRSAWAYNYDDLVCLVTAEQKALGKSDGTGSLDERLRAVEIAVLGHAGSGTEKKRLNLVCARLGMNTVQLESVSEKVHKLAPSAASAPKTQTGAVSGQHATMKKLPGTLEPKQDTTIVTPDSSDSTPDSPTPANIDVGVSNRSDQRSPGNMFGRNRGIAREAVGAPARNDRPARDITANQKSRIASAKADARATVKAALRIAQGGTDSSGRAALRTPARADATVGTLSTNVGAVSGGNASNVGSVSRVTSDSSDAPSINGTGDGQTTTASEACSTAAMGDTGTPATIGSAEAFSSDTVASITVDNDSAVTANSSGIEARDPLAANPIRDRVTALEPFRFVFDSSAVIVLAIICGGIFLTVRILSKRSATLHRLRRTAIRPKLATEVPFASESSVEEFAPNVVKPNLIGTDSPTPSRIESARPEVVDRKMPPASDPRALLASMRTEVEGVLPPASLSRVVTPLGAAGGLPVPTRVVENRPWSSMPVSPHESVGAPIGAPDSPAIGGLPVPARIAGSWDAAPFGAAAGLPATARAWSPIGSPDAGAIGAAAGLPVTARIAPPAGPDAVPASSAVGLLVAARITSHAASPNAVPVGLAGGLPVTARITSPAASPDAVPVSSAGELPVTARITSSAASPDAVPVGLPVTARITSSAASPDAVPVGSSIGLAVAARITSPAASPDVVLVGSAVGLAVATRITSPAASPDAVPVGSAVGLPVTAKITSSAASPDAVPVGSAVGLAVAARITSPAASPNAVPVGSAVGLPMTDRVVSPSVSLDAVGSASGLPVRPQANEEKIFSAHHDLMADLFDGDDGPSTKVVQLPASSVTNFDSAPEFVDPVSKQCLTKRLDEILSPHSESSRWLTRRGYLDPFKDGESTMQYYFRAGTSLRLDVIVTASNGSKRILILRENGDGSQRISAPDGEELVCLFSNGQVIESNQKIG